MVPLILTSPGPSLERQAEKGRTEADTRAGGDSRLGAKAVLARPRRMQVLGENISVCEYERHSPRAEAGAGLWVKWPDLGTEIAGLGSGTTLLDVCFFGRPWAAPLQAGFCPEFSIRQ